jgi:hypothetical protein
MITIVRQDALHQYDADGRAITTWNDKYCSWIINPEFESSQISWQDDVNGISEFPRGCTKAEYLKDNPDADSRPDIEVTWFYKNREDYLKSIGYESEGEWKRFLEKTGHSDPTLGREDNLTAERSWRYLSYSPEEAIERLGRYTDFNKLAYKVKIVYNHKIIYNKELK